MPSLLSPCLWPPLPRPTFFLPFFSLSSVCFLCYSAPAFKMQVTSEAISCSCETQMYSGNQSHGTCIVQSYRNSSPEIHCVTNGLFMIGHDDLKRWATHIKKVNWRIIILLLAVTNGRQLPCESKLCRQQSQGCSITESCSLQISIK